jgi:N-acetylneuraminic acid mutarotase
MSWRTPARTAACAAVLACAAAVLPVIPPGPSARAVAASRTLATVTGTVRDASGHGWPLYARVTVAGTGITGYTDPVTGGYRLSVPVTGSPDTLDVAAVYPGYQAARARINPDAGSLRLDFGLTADAESCTAPGYRAVYHGYTEDFSARSKPPGWTVLDLTGSGVNWRFDNPAGRPNLTGGSGNFAIMDALYPPPNPLGEGSMLISPALNLSKDATPVLQFDQELMVASASGGTTAAPIELSVDGGKTWNYLRQQLQSVPGPVTEVLPMPQAAGKTQVKVAFAAAPDFTGSVWEVDDVFVGERRCEPAAGGLVVGQVRDRNTGAPVDGATVTDGAQPGGPATMMPSPGDLTGRGGVYWLFTPSPAAQTLTASAPGYADATARVDAAAGAVTRADLALPAGRLAVTPGHLAVTEAMGAATTRRLTVTNTGSATATLSVAEQPGPFILASRAFRPADDPAAADVPLRRIAGRYTTAPLLGTGRRARPAQEAGAAAGPWAPAPDYPQDVYDNAVATDPATGLVYSVGGSGPTLFGLQAYVYNPAAGSWTRLPDASYARAAGVAAVVGGSLYVTAGYQPTQPLELQPATEIYDPDTGQWTGGAPIPDPVYGAAAAVLDGRMYVVGGCSLDLSSGSGVCDGDRVQVYDPATDHWSAAAPYPIGVGFASCGSLGGRLYCAGGFEHDRQAGTAAAYSYDPRSNTWLQIASMPTDLWGSGYTTADGRLLISGGITRFDSLLTNVGFGYHPSSNTWQSLPNSPETLYRGGSACGFYRIGGVNSSSQAVASSEQLPGYTDCGGTGVAWLSASPAQVRLAPGQSTTITLTVSTGRSLITQPGSYAASVYLNSGGPYPPPAADLMLTAEPPATWGKVTGTVSGRGCGGTTVPLAGATVQVGSGQTLTTDRDGRYATWLDQRYSPVTLIVVADWWIGQTRAVKIIAGQTTTADFTLSRASCG